MGPGAPGAPGGSRIRGPAYGIYLKAMLNAQAHINYHVLLYATHIITFNHISFNFFIYHLFALFVLFVLFMNYSFLSFDYFGRRSVLKN